MKRLATLVLSGMMAVTVSAQNTFSFGTRVNPQGSVFEVDSRGFIVDGKHKLPVMGEIHYSRVPQADWQREIRKMKAGGITILATYCFWLHHEPQENHWNWSGSNDLHRFLEVCREENMPVILRIGPFCHGEVYHGGMPDWVIEKAQRDPKQYKQRSLAPGFMAATRRLYSNIFAQVNDMLWKDGGPIVGVQIENECRGPWDYYMALKKMALEIGFDAPFYTRTGWPKLNGKETFGEMLPLYSDYADGFWDRSLTDMPGDYPKAFCMKDARISATVATETFGKDALTDSGQQSEGGNGGLTYPYLTCELGGGMMPSYHRRINMTGCEPLPLAVCKLGSGSNLLGYYMYHGGTNPSYDAVYNFTTPSAYTPDGHTTAETQASLVTNYNDMPLMTYDFQCPLGEMGQPNLNAFHQTRWLHQFLADWGEELSQMDVDTLSEHYARRGCFEFYNDYVRIINEGGRAYVRPVKMPFRGHTITADAQPFCKVGDTLYFIPVKGMKPTVIVDGKKCVPYKAKTFGDIAVQVLTEDNARRAYKIDGELVLSANPDGILYKDGNDVICEYWDRDSHWNVDYRQTSEAAAPRTIPMGRQKVAAMPGNEDFQKAAVWSLDLHDIDDSIVNDCFLEISYSADCARLYADGRLVEDNFWNGKPMLVRMSDLVKDVDGRKVQKQIELRILPLAKDAPIYLQKAQREELQNADATKGLLSLHGIKVIQRVTQKQ